MARSASLLKTVFDDVKSTLPIQSSPDDDMNDVLEAVNSLGPKPIETLTPAQARLQPTAADGVAIVQRSKGISQDLSLGVRAENILIPGSIEARIYYPPQASTDGALPVVLYFHGGGFVIADLDTYDATPRLTAKAVGAIVISVAYRRAPEHKFPAAHDDAFRAYKWTLANVEKLGGDAKRVAVMGESAGANLAIHCAIAARDTGTNAPVRQVLIYPMAGTNMETESYNENAFASPLNKAMMEWFFKNMIQSPTDLNDARLDVVGTAVVDGLPSTTLVLAAIDPLRSEGEILEEKLVRAGVDVNAITLSGVTHEFYGMGCVVAKAKTAEDTVNEDLRRSFALPGAENGPRDSDFGARP